MVRPGLARDPEDPKAGVPNVELSDMQAGGLLVEDQTDELARVGIGERLTDELRSMHSPPETIAERKLEQGSALRVQAERGGHFDGIAETLVGRGLGLGLIPADGFLVVIRLGREVWIADCDNCHRADTQGATDEQSHRDQCPGYARAARIGQWRGRGQGASGPSNSYGSSAR